MVNSIFGLMLGFCLGALFLLFILLYHGQTSIFQGACPFEQSTRQENLT
jgi:hypothetical protein